MDIKIVDEGSVILFVPKNDEAKTWMNENLQVEGWQRLGDNIAVDHRSAGIIIEALEDNGFTLG